MVIVWNGRKIAWFLAVILVIQLSLASVLCLRLLDTEDTSLVNFTVVIDAGHGGIDGGVTGALGTRESDLNLLYAQDLGDIFEGCGFKVVYTRTNKNGLYGTTASGYKRRDMEARRNIVVDSKADMVISVHMNRYSDSTRKGPQVFFQKGSEDGRSLAECIQTTLNQFTGNKHAALSGDFFMCRCSDAPSVIVECGFLSNPQEEKLLLDDTYRQKLTETVFSGIMLYLYSQ